MDQTTINAVVNAVAVIVAAGVGWLLRHWTGAPIVPPAPQSEKAPVPSPLLEGALLEVLKDMLKTLQAMRGNPEIPISPPVESKLGTSTMTIQLNPVVVPVPSGNAPGVP